MTEQTQENPEIEIPDIEIGFVIGLDKQGGVAFKVITDPAHPLDNNSKHLWILSGLSRIADKMIEELIDEALTRGLADVKRTIVGVAEQQLKVLIKGFQKAASSHTENKIITP